MISQTRPNALMDRNIPVLMTSFPKLINSLGGLYSGERNEYLQNLNHYQLLIIDDLGVERNTPYVLETVYLVIDERYKSGKPFIITTNLSLQELPDRQGQSKQGERFGHFEGIGEMISEMKLL